MVNLITLAIVIGFFGLGGVALTRTAFSNVKDAATEVKQDVQDYRDKRKAAAEAAAKKAGGMKEGGGKQ